jgi:hypothetical protein
MGVAGWRFAHRKRISGRAAVVAVLEGLPAICSLAVAAVSMIMIGIMPAAVKGRNLSASDADLSTDAAVSATDVLVDRGYSAFKLRCYAPSIHSGYRQRTQSFVFYVRPLFCVESSMLHIRLAFFGGFPPGGCATFA